MEAGKLKSGSCHRRRDCRLCGGAELTLVVSLTPTPPANAFVAAEDRDKRQAVYPLDVFFCETCAHVQLLDVVDQAHLFEDYVYVSGTSPVFVGHFGDYARDIMARFQPPEGGLVVDIGSNDGTLLKFFKGAGLAVLGIDPAAEIAARATAAGIETIPGFFSIDMGRRIATERGPASVVTANNVFAHMDDIAGALDGVSALLDPDGVFVFEVSYLADVVEKTLFDTIYHEHLDYHSVKPLRRFLAAGGMELIEATRTDSHGGSLRYVARHGGSGRGPGPSVEAMVAMEEEMGLDQAHTFHRFAEGIDKLGAELRSLLDRLRDEGSTIAGFGAPAKATTLMYHFGIGPETLDFIVDDSPLKQGLFTPGLHIPVLPTSALYELKPDHALILAWNFAPEIMEKNAAFRQAGGRFIVPLPDIELV